MSTQSKEPAELSAAEWLGKIGELEASRTEARGKVVEIELTLSETVLDHRIGRPGAGDRLSELRRSLDEHAQAAGDLDIAVEAARQHLQRAQHREALANWNKLMASLQREAATRLRGVAQLAELAVQFHSMLVTVEETGRRMQGYLTKVKDLDPGSMNTASVASDLYGEGLYGRFMRSHEDLFASVFGFAKHPMPLNKTYLEVETAINARLLSDLKDPPGAAAEPAPMKPRLVA